MDGHTKLTTEDNNADSVDRSLLQHEVQCNLEYPFEDYDHGEEQYYKELAILHKEHMECFLLGIFTDETFLPDIVHDVYLKHMYAMSWFYDGIYSFDSYKSEKDSYLCDQVYQK
jgi:alpha-N-acetylglucosamine transferase